MAFGAQYDRDVLKGIERLSGLLHLVLLSPVVLA
jgi:hypothetical protein